MLHGHFPEQNHTESQGGHGADAPQTGLGRKTEFSGMGLHGMRMGF